MHGVAYQKKSEEEFVNDHQKRMEQNLHRRAKEMGYEWKRIEAPKDAVAALAVSLTMRAKKAASLMARAEVTYRAKNRDAKSVRIT